MYLRGWGAGWACLFVRFHKDHLWIHDTCKHISSEHTRRVRPQGCFRIKVYRVPSSEFGDVGKPEDVKQSQALFHLSTRTPPQQPANQHAEEPESVVRHESQIVLTTSASMSLIRVRGAVRKMAAKMESGRLGHIVNIHLRS